MRQTKTTTALIREVKMLMHQAGYSDRTIGRYNHCWNAFLDYGGTEQTFSSGKAVDFKNSIWDV